MAYVTQEMKKELAPGIKAVLKKYGMKGSISINNYSSLVVTLQQGPLDFTTLLLMAICTVKSIHTTLISSIVE